MENDCVFFLCRSSIIVSLSYYATSRKDARWKVLRSRSACRICTAFERAAFHSLVFFCLFFLCYCQQSALHCPIRCRLAEHSQAWRKQKTERLNMLKKTMLEVECMSNMYWVRAWYPPCLCMSRLTWYRFARGRAECDAYALSTGHNNYVTLKERSLFGTRRSEGREGEGSDWV